MRMSKVMIPVRYLKQRILLRELSYKENKYHDFPFLRDLKTVNYVSKSKVLFIMRGLPGSGKSFLANQIRERYGESNITCSADHYFIQPDGSYVHDKDKLHQAHKFCQETCKKAMLVEKKHIIIDNTNVQKFEMNTYLNLARENSYVPLIVQPKTSWSHDVNTLAKKNTHGCPVELIEKKKKQFIDINPTYYGFFLNEFDSTQVQNLAKKHFLEIVKLFPDFARTLASHIPDSKENLFEKYFNIKNKNLHCTTCFIDHNTSSYSSNDLVLNSIGKCFQLHISGFIFTPRVTAAVIELKKAPLKLWNSQDAFSYVKDENGNLIPSKAPYSDIKEPLTDSLNQKQETSSEIDDSSTQKNANKKLTIQIGDDNNLHVDLAQLHLHKEEQTIGDASAIFMKNGSRAHLTIGCHKVENIQSGFEVLSLKYMHEKGMFEEIVHQNDFTFINYGSSGCEVQFDWPLPINSLFAGCYLS